MKILMFGWEFPPYNSGGLGTACYGLSKALSSEGVEIIFVLPKAYNYNTKINNFRILCANLPNIEIEEIDSPISPYITNEKDYQQIIDESGFDNTLYGKSLFEEVNRYAKKAREIANREDFDLIHAHDWLSFRAGVEAKKISGKPLVVHVHATEFDRTGNSGVNQFVYDIEQEGIDQADKIIVVSNFTKDILMKHYAIDSAKISTVHNGIDVKSFGTPLGWSGSLAELKRAGNKIVLFVGRITLQKGPDYFLETAKKVLEYSPDVIFIMAGAGDMQRRIIRDAARLGIADKMLLTGFLQGEELKKLYQASDLYVMPSVSEPFGITPLEALASNTPVIISKQSGVAEVLKDAIKVDFWDTDLMTRKILSILNHKSYRRWLREKGKQQLKNITWTKSAKKCMDIYKKIIK